MSILIKKGEVYTPNFQGQNDVLIINDKIFLVRENIPKEDIPDNDLNIINASGKLVLPGFIDQHVHFNGAGGEGGPEYRTAPLQFNRFIKAGITTAIGLLGTDGIARSLKALFQKARGLERKGISTWMYTGSYQVPPPTLTGSVKSDILLINKVIGIKTAISDHRSSHPTIEDLTKLTSSARVGGLLAGKPGVVHIHMGSEGPGLTPIINIIEDTDIPIEQFAPTHLTRNTDVFNDAIAFGNKGGYVDLTAKGALGDPNDPLNPSNAVNTLLEENVPVEKITMSTDGGGSLPKFNAKGELESVSTAPVSSLLEEFKKLIQRENISTEHAIRIVSTNIAQHLGLKQKGMIKSGNDADILLIEKNTLELESVIAKGKLLLHNGRVNYP